jgi:hypothetical protein
VLTADVLQRMVHIPHVPLQQARQLVVAGVHISYAQLLTAGSIMVAGVEAWVQALQELERFSYDEQLGSLHDIPAEAVAICCARTWVS